MKLRHIMRADPWTINDTDTLGGAQRIMVREGVRHLPVVSEGQVVGMLAERDILAARAHADGEEPWWTIGVREVMRQLPEVAHPDDTAAAAATQMVTAKVGALPVIDRGALVGLVTTTDVLAAETRAPAMHDAVQTVADAMTGAPITVGPETLVLDAIARMVDRRVRHLPVVDASGAVVGVLSARDIRGGLSGIGGLDRETAARLREYRAHQLMSRPAVTVRHDEPLATAIQRLIDLRIGALPVVNGEGALVGMLSYLDALRIAVHSMRAA